MKTMFTNVSKKLVSPLMGVLVVVVFGGAFFKNLDLVELNTPRFLLLALGSSLVMMLTLLLLEKFKLFRFDTPTTFAVVAFGFMVYPIVLWWVQGKPYELREFYTNVLTKLVELKYIITLMIAVAAATIYTGVSYLKNKSK